MRESDRESSPVALSILVSHLEIRHRCLQLLVSGKGLPVDSMVSINDLRQYLERWTDLLLSQMGSLDAGSKFCFSHSRLREYYLERADHSSVRWRETAWKLRTTGVRTWLARNCSQSTGGAAAMNRSVADSIVKMSRPEWFDSLGLLRSELIERMYADRPEQQATAETILPGLATSIAYATESSDGKQLDSESELANPFKTDERFDFSRFQTRDR
jgi:hypothetical protein